MGGFGFPPVEDVGYRPMAPAPAVFELRPLSTGEILDRTFVLYRQRFWLYVGLSSAAAAVTTVAAFVQLTLGPVVQPTPQTKVDPAAVMHQAVVSLGILFAVALVDLMAYSVTQAATVSAVEANYLGRETSIGTAFSTIRSQWYRYILVTLWQAWSFMWPVFAIIIPAAVVAGVMAAAGGGRTGAVLVALLLILLMIPGFVVGMIFYLRNALGIVACVSEGLTVRRSMKRSKFLVADHKGRIFLLYLLVFVLLMAAGVLQTIFNVFLLRSHGAVHVGAEISTLLVTFISRALVQPVGAIAFVLFYIDQRVRKEGYDVEMLLEQVSGVPAPPRAGESSFGSVFGAGPVAGSSPFSSGPLPGSTPVPVALGADSPFSSGPLPESTDSDTHE